MKRIEIEPVSPVLGANVYGLELGSELCDGAGIDDATFATVHGAFLDHGVLFFRQQSALAPGQQIAFAQRFGPLHTHPAVPGEGAGKAVFVIHTHRESSVANGNGWHTDVSCEPTPPMATMLQLHQLPEGGGGDTLFANTEAAYATMSSEDRELLETLTARHESEHVYRGRYADRGVDDEGTTYPSSEHPVVRTHPETGRPGLYINRSFTTRILGLQPEQSDTLLRRLLRHIERPEFQIRLHWNTNDIALWDNRCLQHFAVWDYWPNERKGHRVTIEGSRPYFDPAAADPEPSSVRVSTGALTRGIDA